MSDPMSSMVPIMFIIVIGIIIFSLGQGIVTWNKNNQSPRLTVSAVIVAKRKNITHHQHANAGDASGAHGFYTTTNTTYYVTFQTESGDRMEFQAETVALADFHQPLFVEKPPRSEEHTSELQSP